MKKAFVLLLAMILILGLATPAYAAKSPVGTDDLPLVINTTANNYQLITINQAYKLSKEDQEIFRNAQRDLRDSVYAGTNVRYFFFFAASEACDAVLNIDGFSMPIFQQYVNGEWVELDYVDNGDGTVTVLGVNHGPMAISFMTNGKNDPLLITTTSKEHKLIITQDLNKMSAADGKAFQEAYEAMADAVPEDMRVRYFFFLSTNETCDALFNVDGDDKPVYMQYVDGKWTEAMEYENKEDDNTLVHDVAHAPMMICFPKGE